jgi:hypothetical protein
MYPAVSRENESRGFNFEKNIKKKIKCIQVFLQQEDLM